MLCGVLVIALALPLLQTSPAHGQADILEVHDTLDDLDNRAGSIAPTAAQKTIANNLKATVRWNRFGTPQSMIKYGGYLAVASIAVALAIPSAGAGICSGSLVPDSILIPWGRRGGSCFRRWCCSPATESVRGWSPAERRHKLASRPSSPFRSCSHRR